MLAEIENGIVATIKAATGMLYLKTCDSYAGQIDEGLNEVVRSYPAVWVTFGGSAKPTKTGANTWKVPATFVVMVAARNVRNEKAARVGTVNEVGAYQILKDVRALLLNQDLGLEIERLAPGAIKTLYNTKVGKDALAIYSQEWTTAFVDHMPTEAAVDLLKIGINYYLKPGDEVSDASDVLTITP
jgi:phage gp37-like protein